MLAILAGVSAVQLLPELPAANRWGLWAVSWLPSAVVASSRRRHRLAGQCAAAWLGFGLGAAWAAWHAHARLDDALAPAHHDVVTRLAVRVTDIAQGDAGQWRFTGEPAEGAPAGVPARIAVSWRASQGMRLPEPLPGQVWRMALVLRHPHGTRNPHGNDAEGRFFASGIGAMATVRGMPVLLRDQPWASAGVVIERMRHHVRAAMREAIGQRRYAPVLVALAMGDQAGVLRDDWRIFNRTGITHLVSISGMHVTLIAGLGGYLAMFAWRRARWRHIGLPERVPAQMVGAAVALGTALLYCLLAGWGVPARRTFFMLAVVAVAAMMRLPLSGMRVLALAAAAVVLFDPWAVLAPGFWLSFGAVAILLRAADTPAPAARSGWTVRLGRLVQEFSRIQMAITLGLVPLLAYLVHQVSLASPVVNAYAIPIVSFLVTPLALLCAAFAAVPGLQFVGQACGIVGHAIFEAMMWPTLWAATSPWAVMDVAAAPWPWVALAAVGVAWALQPSGWPARGAGWLLLLPMLCWRPERPAAGHWTLTALDVGQGSAIVLETATQAWLIDTGPRHGDAADAGERYIVPFLRARGYRRLDGLVVSHADLDHAGGLASVLASMSVSQAHASFDMRAKVTADTTPAGAAMPRLPQSMRRCAAGQAWHVDGVAFRFLHPPEGAGGEGNAYSCVLLVQGRSHAVLLPGDIGAAQERGVARQLPRTDVVLAPHHGSATSSSAPLVGAAQAAHVIAQAGRLNRFRHPSPRVQARWEAAGARFWRTDVHGAVTVISAPGDLEVRAHALASRRYWHREARH